MSDRPGLTATTSPAMRQRGFTLIELLVVIAIIALLVSILLPTLRTAKWLAESAVCKSHLRSIGLSSHMYLDGNDGHFPITTPPSMCPPQPGAYGHNWALKLCQQDYSDRGAFECPGIRDEPRGPWYDSVGYYDDWGACAYTAHVWIYLNWVYFTGKPPSHTMPLNNALDTIKDPGTIALMWDDGWVGPGVSPVNLSPSEYLRRARGGMKVFRFRHGEESLNVLFADGHVEQDYFPLPEEWDVANQG